MNETKVFLAYKICWRKQVMIEAVVNKSCHRL